MTLAVLPKQAEALIVLAIISLGILTPLRGTQAGANLGTSAKPLQPGLRPKENLLGLRLRGGTSLASEHIVRTTFVYNAPPDAIVNVVGSWYSDSALLDGMLNITAIYNVYTRVIGHNHTRRTERHLQTRTWNLSRHTCCVSSFLVHIVRCAVIMIRGLHSTCMRTAEDGTACCFLRSAWREFHGGVWNTEECVFQCQARVPPQQFRLFLQCLPARFADSLEWDMIVPRRRTFR